MVVFSENKHNLSHLKISKFLSVKLIFAVFFLLTMWGNTIIASDFISNNISVFPKVINGAAACGDFNNDGFYDLAICGDTGVSGTPVLVFQIFKNNGNQTFSKIASLKGLFEGEIKWADLNNDGFSDIIACGAEAFDPVFSDYTPAIVIYKNNGNGTFSEISNHNITPLCLSSLDVADLNKDGNIDVVISGKDAFGAYKTTVYKNTGNAIFSIVENLNGVHHSRIKFGDYNFDGYADLIYSGFTDASNQPKTYIYSNDGDGSFTMVSNSLAAASYGDICWADFNNDGYDDIVLSGSFGGGFRKIYKNAKSGIFQDSTDSDIPGLIHSSVDVADFDMDGDLDVFSMGNNVTSFSKLLINEGNFNFSTDSYTFPGMVHPTFACADINNDGKMDMLLSGPPSDAGKKATYLYVNNSVNTNTAPSVPINLSASDQGQGNILLSWDPANDPQGSSKTITYNVYIGTSPGTDNRLNSQSNLTNGKRAALLPGNNGHSNTLSIKLEPGTYYWGVQSIDNSFLPSAFSSEGSFTVVSTGLCKGIKDQSSEIIFNRKTLAVECFMTNVSAKTTVTITDTKGIVLKSKIFKGTPCSISVNDLPKGVYMVILHGSNLRHVERIVVY